MICYFIKFFNHIKDNNIIQFSAAVYSGVGGYAAFGPSLIGLTPAQFREIKYEYF